MPDNGVSRREFDRLEQRVDQITREGSPAVARMQDRIDGLREDMHQLEQTVDRRLSNITRVGVGILLALIGGLITLLTALASGSLG